MFSAETDDQVDSSMIDDPSGPIEVGLNVGLRIIELEFQDRVTLRGDGGQAAGVRVDGSQGESSEGDIDKKTLVRLLVDPQTGVEIINENDYQKSLTEDQTFDSSSSGGRSSSRGILGGQPLTKIPLHLVNSSAIDRCEAKQSSSTSDDTSNTAKAAAEAHSAGLQGSAEAVPSRFSPLQLEASSSSKANSGKNIQGQQILPPIEVGLQLGHPAIISEEKAEKAPQEAVVEPVAVTETVDSAAQTEAEPPPVAVKVVDVAHAEVQTHASPEVEVVECPDLTRHSTSTTTTSSQTDLAPTELSEQSSGDESGAKQLARSQVQEASNVNPPVTSETQTVQVQSEDSTTQTSIVDRSDEAVQTEPPELAGEREQLPAQLSTDTLSYSDVVVEQPSRPVDSANLPQRPPTLPGSSIDLPFEDEVQPVQRPETVFTSHFQSREQSFLSSRTRTVSPTNLKVQDDVVARVLLEHVGTVFPDQDPRQLRSGVNYLDLSRLGDEGETPASDEIWLAVDGSGCQSEDDQDVEDKFLTTDDTETYSIATDKLSTAATLAGYGNVNLDSNANLAGLSSTGGLLDPSDLAGSSANLLSEQELADLGGCESFDAEAEATARLQGVLASELIPLHTTVKDTGKNIVDLTDKFEKMETVLGSVSNTVETLQSMVKGNNGSKSGSRQNSQDGGDGSDGISIRRTNNPGAVKRASINIEDFKNTDVRLLDQLVARIEHLSSDVANMDASRQLREDNLLLRKELQTYREREVQMNQRLELLEKRLNDMQGGGHHKSGGKSGSRHRRSSIGSNSSRKSTPELPPIDTGPRSRSVDSRKEKKEKEVKDVQNLPPTGNDSDSRQKTPPKSSEETNLDFNQIVKQPLINAQVKLNKKGMKIPRRTSNSSSGSGNGSGSDTEIRGRDKRKPITPKLDNDYLQTEIQIQRSDNSILRQDIQVFRTREQQLYSRNQDLQEKLVEALSPRHSARKDHDDSRGKEQSEAVINVDFVGENEPGGPKAVFEAKTKPKSGSGSGSGSRRDSSKDRRSSRDSSKERGPLKKAPSSERIAVPKSKRKTSSSSEESVIQHVEKVEEAETKHSASSDGSKKSVKIQDPSAKNGVPKTKPTANGKKPTAAATGAATKGGKKPPAKSPKGSTSSEKDPETGPVLTSAGSERLLEDDEWKVTVESKHELETIQTDPNKIVVVKPKPKEKEKVEEEVKVAKKAAAKKKKIEKKEKKDIIPKPSMVPAARPSRGYCPPRVM